MVDACGLAGGSPSRKNHGAEAGDYTPTKYASHGDYGTKVLKELPIPAPVWKRGGAEEVAWQVRNNHGGGYSYRLCPTPENFTDLSEACFQMHPLDFVQTEQ